MLNITEHKSSNYADRTRDNVKLSDVTIAFVLDPNSPGEKLTKRLCLEYGKPYILININSNVNYKSQIYELLHKLYQIKISQNQRNVCVNIAGNSLSTMYKLNNKITQELCNIYVFNYLADIFKLLQSKINMCIRTGGQTGFDEAGAKLGISLGLPTTILFPYGYKIRNIHGIDVNQTYQQVLNKYL